LNEKDYHWPGGKGTAAGVDVGATLAKLALRSADRRTEFRLLPSEDLPAIARQLGEAACDRVGVTGGGAAGLARRLRAEPVQVNEFAAWGAGSAALLERHGLEAGERHLLVSLGTGTSVLLVDGMAVTRLGGTALGGGTLLGLAAGLIGVTAFPELAALAASGRRERIDLRVSDIYRAGGIPLAGDLTAANFGKLAARLDAGDPVPPADIAHALMGLVGENVALVCGGLAAVAQVQRIVFAGSTLRGNEALIQILDLITRALGREPSFLPQGEFAGALGALLLASDA
jgi:type II pantothenate kinase